MLVKQLPAESATATALRLAAAEGETSDLVDLVESDPETEQWSRTEHLLAAVKDELVVFRWVWSQGHAGRRKLQWKPEPTVRPGVGGRKQKPRLDSVQANFLYAHLRATQGYDEE